MIVNINRMCLIRETVAGSKVMDEHFRKSGICEESHFEVHFRQFARQPDGRLKMPLWQVMMIYGPAIYMAMSPCFVDNEIEILNG